MSNESLIKKFDTDKFIVTGIPTTLYGAVLSDSAIKTIIEYAEQFEDENHCIFYGMIGTRLIFRKSGVVGGGSF